MNDDYYRIEKALYFTYENFKAQPSLDEIAESVNLSPFHFQRLFKRWAGITPKKFLQFLTIEYTKNVLNETNDIFDATFNAGLSSTSRLHDLFINIESVSPSEYKSKGMNLTIYYGFHNSPFGECLIAITEKGICGIYFVQNSKEEVLNDLKRNWINAKLIHDEKLTKEYIDKIFYGSSEPLNIFLKGTNFQIQVWKALLSIPKGKLTTYEKVANKINNPKALRAVGTAIGSNPLSYLIPCHRVINKIGKIGNYGGGRMRKKAMIGWEASKLVISSQ